jgi:tripartite-type tricarboxylate transporter receptor subunit TctC
MEKLKFLVALCAGLVAFPAVAQTYPERPVRIVVTLSPGSTSDILARVVGDQMSKGLGQPVVIENRPGAGGNVAGAAVKATPADGYTLMLATISSHGINPALYAKMPYDALKDFTPIALLGSSPNVLIAGPGVPASSVKELIALVKSGNHNFASGGNGTSHHLSAELFNAMIGAKGTHIPYKGSPEAVTAVMKGDVTFMFPNAPNAVPLAKSGKLKLLAVTTPKRVSWLPDVPTVAESGLPGFDVTAWFGLVAPAGTPEPIIQKLNAEANKALGVQSVRDALVNQGFELMGGSTKEMGDFMRAEIDKWTRVVKLSGAKVE